MLINITIILPNPFFQTCANLQALMVKKFKVIKINKSPISKNKLLAVLL